MRVELPELRRCCFYMPLRQGLLIVGYLNMILCIVMASLVISEVLAPYTKIFMGRIFHVNLPMTLIVIMYLLEFIFDIVLVCGIHMRRVLLLRIYYYYMIAIFVFSFVMEIIEVSMYPYIFLESILLYCATFCLNFYVLLLVRSLIKKLEIPEREAYGNPLQQFVNGELDPNSRDPCTNVSSDKELV